MTNKKKSRRHAKPRIPGKDQARKMSKVVQRDYELYGLTPDDIYNLEHGFYEYVPQWLIPDIAMTLGIDDFPEYLIADMEAEMSAYYGGHTDQCKPSQSDEPEMDLPF